MIQLKKKYEPSIFSYQDYLSHQSFEKMYIKKFFDYWISVTIDIVTGLDRHGIIRITKLSLRESGYSNRQTFEEELLSKIYEIVEKITGIDIDEIRIKMKDKIMYI